MAGKWYACPGQQQRSNRNDTVSVQRDLRPATTGAFWGADQYGQLPALHSGQRKFFHNPSLWDTDCTGGTSAIDDRQCSTQYFLWSTSGIQQSLQQSTFQLASGWAFQFVLHPLYIAVQRPGCSRRVADRLGRIARGDSYQGYPRNEGGQYQGGYGPCRNLF